MSFGADTLKLSRAQTDYIGRFARLMGCVCREERGDRHDAVYIVEECWRDRHAVVVKINVALFGLDGP